MDDLLQEFIAETRETLEALASELVVWEANPHDKERLDAIFRFFHTVKGSCGFLDLPRFERLSHAAEDVLSQLRDGSRDASATLVDAILAVVDRIAELIAVMESGDSLPDGSDADLIAALNDEPEERPIVPAAMPADGPVTATLEAAPGARARSIRVPLELIDHLMNNVSDMVLARNEVARCLREQGQDPATEGAFERLSACIADMRDAIGQTRMQRIERIFSPIPRMVRDLTLELGKQVELRTAGSNVELDREMIEMIRDPLTHIVRNAIDHGIETPEQRVASGKPASGRLMVSARQSGNQILIEISDDGRGINLERLVTKAIAARVKTATEAQTLSERAKLDLIFAPGLSTAETVTSISGRGVGMDVVRANIERVGGSIDLENHEGHGLKVTLRVPLTLTIIPCLTVRAGGQEFAMPRSSIHEILFDNNDQVRVARVGGTDLAYIRGECLPLLGLERILGLDHGDEHDMPDRPVRRTIVTVNAASDLRYALAVEAVLDHEELVVRPGAPVIMGNGLYAGTTLPDNGRPMLLLDPLGLSSRAQLSEQMRLIENAEPTAPADAEDDAPDAGSGLLFRDSDGVTRVIRLAVVERVEDIESDRIVQAGGGFRVRVDDESRPVFGLDALPERGEVKMLHLTDGYTHLHYAIEDIVDIVRLPITIEPAVAPGLVAGVVLIDGQQIEKIDVHWLFSAAANGAVLRRAQHRTCCLLGAEDGWARNILAPLLRAAGYRLVFDTTGLQTPDLYIAADPAAVPPGLDAPVISLLDYPQRGGDDPMRVYRYDRAALMRALEAPLLERTGS